MRHLLKPLCVALCGALLSFAAAAKTFDQAGTAPTQLEPVGTYAAGAPVRSSLKALVPKDWQIMVHRGLQLPATMDWSAGQTWPQVLANFAQTSGFSVLVDWDQRSVFLRPVEVALEDAVRRAQVSQASVTPLPALTPAQPAIPAILQNAQPPSASVEKATMDAMTAKLASIEAELGKLAEAKAKGQAETETALAALRSELNERNQTLATAQAELAATKRAADEARAAADAAKSAADAAQTTAVASTKALEDAQFLAKAVVSPSPEPGAVMAAAQGYAVPANVATEYQSLTIGQGFNRAPVHEVAAKVAELHGATLEFRAPADLAFPGPVTILGSDLGEDVRLMLRALGPDTQVSFDLCRQPAYLRVVPAIAGSSSKYSEAACSHPALVLAAAPSKAPATTAGTATSSPDAAATTPVAAATAPKVAPAPATPVLPAVAEPIPVLAKAEPSLTQYAGEAQVPAEPRAPLASYKFSLLAGADLETGLRDFLKSNGYELKWDSEFEFAATDPLNAEGKDLVEVLTQFLPKMGLEAEINTQERIVRVNDKRNEVKN
jgi:hypothetical protein